VGIQKYICIFIFFVVQCHGITFESDYSIRMPSPSVATGIAGAALLTAVDAISYWWTMAGVCAAKTIMKDDEREFKFNARLLVTLRLAFRFTLLDVMVGGTIAAYVPIIGALLDYRTYCSIQQNAQKCFASPLASSSMEEFTALVKEGSKEHVLKEIDVLMKDLEDFSLAMRGLVATAKGRGGDWYELFYIKGKGLLEAMGLVMVDLANKKAILEKECDHH
jgi:hypothetical protein